MVKKKPACIAIVVMILLLLPRTYLMLRKMSQRAIAMKLLM
jgi:hypothetical protein